MAREVSEKTNKTTKKNAEKVVSKNLDIDEIRNDLLDYMEAKIDKATQKAVDKATKKLIHHKNIIIVKRDITILVLLIICFFLGYNLYNVSNINIDITTDKKEVNKIETIDTEENQDSLKELKEKYAPLIEDIYLNEKSEYLENFYKGELNEETKLYLCLNSMDADKVVNEDETVYIDGSDLSSVYNELFEGKYSPKSFRYGSLNFKYLASKELFIADGEFKKIKTNIVREIADIAEKEDDLEISTIEGLITDGKLYNILSNEEVKKYDGSELSNYSKSLTSVVYYFSKVDDNYKLRDLKVNNI